MIGSRSVRIACIKSTGPTGHLMIDPFFSTTIDRRRPLRNYWWDEKDREEKITGCFITSEQTKNQTINPPTICLIIQQKIISERLSVAILQPRRLQDNHIRLQLFPVSDYSTTPINRPSTSYLDADLRDRYKPSSYLSVS